jgi:hypothetical protein
MFLLGANPLTQTIHWNPPPAAKGDPWERHVRSQQAVHLTTRAREHCGGLVNGEAQSGRRVGGDGHVVMISVSFPNSRARTSENPCNQRGSKSPQKNVPSQQTKTGHLAPTTLATKSCSPAWSSHPLFSPLLAPQPFESSMSPVACAQ